MSLHLILSKVFLKTANQQPQQIYCSFNFPQLQIGQVQNISNKKSYVFEPIQKINILQKSPQGVYNSVKVSVWKYQPHQLIIERLFDFNQIFCSNRRNIYMDKQWEIKFQFFNLKNNDENPSQYKKKDFQQCIKAIPKAIPKKINNSDLLKKVIQNVSNIPKIMETSQKTNRTQRKQHSRQQSSLRSNSHESISLIKKSLKNSISQLKNIGKKYSTNSTQREKNEYGISSTKILTNHQSKTLNKSDLKSFYDSCLSQVQKQQCKKISSVQASQAILSQYGLNISSLNQMLNQNLLNKPQKVLFVKKEKDQPIFYKQVRQNLKQKQIISDSQDKKIENSKKVKKGLTDRNENKNTINIPFNKQSKPLYQTKKGIDKLKKNDPKNKHQDKKEQKSKHMLKK